MWSPLTKSSTITTFFQNDKIILLQNSQKNTNRAYVTELYCVFFFFTLGKEKQRIIEILENISAEYKRNASNNEVCSDSSVPPVNDSPLYHFPSRRPQDVQKKLVKNCVLNLRTGAPHLVHQSKKAVSRGSYSLHRTRELRGRHCDPALSLRKGKWHQGDKEFDLRGGDRILILGCRKAIFNNSQYKTVPHRTVPPSLSQNSREVLQLLIQGIHVTLNPWILMP